MRKWIYSALMLLPLMQSCSDDTPGSENEGGGNQVEVTITTQVETKATVVTTLGDGDEMNVYAKTYGDIEAPDLVSDIKATNYAGDWTIEPSILLSEGGRAFIYAVSPYSPENSNPKAIPVDISRQEDVLYSGSFVPVTYTTHVANLNMKHALMLLSFNILNQGYQGEGKLQGLSVSGNNVYTSGSMDVSTGKIAGSGQDIYVWQSDKTLKTNGWNEDLPSFWMIPFTTQGAEVNLTATIDGQSYSVKFPELEMKGGYQYIYRMVMTANGLQFIPGQIETVSLNTVEDQPEALELYGVLTLIHHCIDFELPTLNGNNAFGTVDWGDGTSGGYEIGGQHTYATSSSVKTVIESWNSTGFILNNLKGIETIDISEYD